MRECALISCRVSFRRRHGRNEGSGDTCRTGGSDGDAGAGLRDGCCAALQRCALLMSAAACSMVDDLAPVAGALVRHHASRGQPSALRRQRSARMGRRRALELCRPRHRRLEIPDLGRLAQGQGQRRLLRLHQGDRGRRPRRQLFRRALARGPRPPACRAAPIISTISAAPPPSRRAGSSRTCPTTARPCRPCWTWSGTRIRRPAS